MRIARIRHLFYPNLPKDYIYYLSAQQVRLGYDVVVFTWDQNQICSNFKVAEGFTISGLKGLNFNYGVLREYPYLPSLPSNIERFYPDIIHGESHLFLPTLQAVKKAKKLGIPSVVTVHGVFAERDLAINLVQQVYLRTVCQSIFKKADKVICLTHENLGEIERLGCPPDKLVLVPNAVDTNLFSPTNEVEDDFIVWVGRFVPEKGLNYLIKAAKLVSKEKNRVKFLLIGYGPSRPAIIEMSKKSGLFGKFVEFAGPQKRESIAKFLRKATVFVFPSVREGMPLALLEAMSCGLPVIVADFPGVNEVVTNEVNGLIVPSRDPLALSKAILYILENRDVQKRLGENARQTILQKHSWEKVTNKLDKVYNDAISCSKLPKGTCFENS